MLLADSKYYALAGSSHSTPFNTKWRVAKVFFLLSVSLSAVPGWGQAARAPAQEAKVNIGAVAALAGDIVDVPLYFSAPDEVKIASLAATISFPRKSLSFTRAELGIMGQRSQAELETSTKDDRISPDLSLLEITISSKEPMKPGILTYLKFKVSVNATKGKFPLKLVNSKTASPSGDPVAMATGMDGAIAVYNTTEEMPLMGCFFFTH